MEQYLIDQYGVIEDENYLKCEDDIKYYVRDMTDELFECGQGYYNDEAEVIMKIGDKFYHVTVYAEIMSSKQDRGDRLYWVDSIGGVSYREIDKPEPRVILTRRYEVEVTEPSKRFLENFMSTNNIKFTEHLEDWSTHGES